MSTCIIRLLMWKLTQGYSSIRLVLLKVIPNWYVFQHHYLYQYHIPRLQSIYWFNTGLDGCWPGPGFQPGSRAGYPTWQVSVGEGPPQNLPQQICVKKPGPNPNLTKTWGQLDQTEDPLRPVLGYFCPGSGLRCRFSLQALVSGFGTRIQGPGSNLPFCNLFSYLISHSLLPLTLFPFFPQIPFRVCFTMKIREHLTYWSTKRLRSQRVQGMCSLEVK